MQRKGERKNQKTVKLEESGVTGNKFICKKAMKYDMTKSQRNSASAARPC